MQLTQDFSSNVRTQRRVLRGGVRTGWEVLEQKLLERWWEVLEQCLSEPELRYAGALFWVGIECTVGGG